jgi:hypothetical protein
MNASARPFDPILAQKAGIPDYINTTNFPLLEVLDREDFVSRYGFQPCVSTIFITTLGGSVVDNLYSDTHNGCLIHAKGWQIYERLFLEKKHSSTSRTIL